MLQHFFGLFLSLDSFTAFEFHRFVCWPDSVFYYSCIWNETRYAV